MNKKTKPSLIRLIIEEIRYIFARGVSVSESPSVSNSSSVNESPSVSDH